MTDTSTLNTAYSQHPGPVNAPSVDSPTVNGTHSDVVVQDENEDYTIKCICSYGDDDGSTVYCERCDTWQHIICYYQGKKVPDIHFCADCAPRQLDAKRASESQRRLREHTGGSDRRTKRPASKSHKKKKDSIATVEQPNGIHLGRHESISAGRDQPPPAKRAKTSHRTSASVTSINGVVTLPEPRKRAASNVNAYPSPTKSPPSNPLHPPIPLYTPEFMNLYHNDRGKDNIDNGGPSATVSNSMSMAVTNDLTSWFDNPFALKQATGRQHEEVFHESDLPLRPQTWPRVSLKERLNTGISYNGQCPRWKYMVLEADVNKDEFIGEIRGDIGRLEDYCLDPTTRWSELRHPEPFVFFHPQIPIYIDSRNEGTQFRYLRRSCHPNVSLRTFVTGERDFHHCFVAKENISAGTELTAMWYIDQTLFNNGKVKEENGDEEEARRRATYFSRILANFGDCACDSSDCWLKNFDLRTLSESPRRRVADGRRIRGKAKNAASPVSTGPAWNSRAGSENFQTTEEEDHADSRSTSGSARSKPQSRDLTPTNLQNSEHPNATANGLSHRERRKIQMVEKAFEIQELKKPRQKRKRTSDGPTTSAPTSASRNVGTSASSLPATPRLASKPPDLQPTNFVGSPILSAPLRRTSDMSPRKSSAPNTPSPLSHFSRPKYVDQGVQTDPEPEEPEEPEPTGPIPGWEDYELPQMRRRRMYMEWERKDRIKKEELIKKIKAGLVGPYATFVPTWLEERRAEDKRRAERRAAKEAAAATGSLSLDVSDSIHAAEECKPSISSTVQLPPPPLPSQAAHTQQSVRPPNDYQFQLSILPPIPTSTNSASSTTQSSMAFSPTSTTPSVWQSPFTHGGSSHSYPGLSAGTVAPNPVKKKLSLGDYMSRRSNLTTPAVEKTQAQATGSTVPAPVVGTVSATVIAQQGPSSRPAPLLKPDKSVKVEAKASSGAGGSAVAESPLTEDDPASIAMPAQPSTAPSMSPELNSVLSNLQALAGNAARRDSGRS